MTDLFERIGGEAAIEAVVDAFYRRILADESIAPFFDAIDMDSQYDKQRRFLAYALGGAPAYPGRSLRDAHAKLVARGLDHSHFNAVARHLVDTLRELDVAPALLAEVLARVSATRNDVLGLEATHA